MATPTTTTHSPQNTPSNTPTTANPAITAETKSQLQYSLATSGTARSSSTSTFIHSIDSKTQDDGSRQLTFTIDKSRATSAVMWRATFEDGALRRGSLGSLTHSACGLIGDIEQKGKFEGVKRVINADGSVTCTMTVASSVKEGCISVAGQAINFNLPKELPKPSGTVGTPAATATGLQYASKEVGSDGSVTMKFALTAEQMKQNVSWRSVDNKGGTIDRRNQQLYSASTTDYSLKREASSDGKGILTVTIPSNTREISLELGGQRATFIRSELSKPEPQPASPPQVPTPAPAEPKPSKDESLLAATHPSNLVSWVSPEDFKVTDAGESLSSDKMDRERARTAPTSGSSNATPTPQGEKTSDNLASSEAPRVQAEVSNKSELDAAQQVERSYQVKKLEAESPPMKSDSSLASGPTVPVPEKKSEIALPPQRPDLMEGNYLVRILGRPENRVKLDALLDQCLSAKLAEKSGKLSEIKDFCTTMFLETRDARAKQIEPTPSVHYVSAESSNAHREEVVATLKKLGHTIKSTPLGEDQIITHLFGSDILQQCRNIIPVFTGKGKGTQFDTMVRDLMTDVIIEKKTNSSDLDIAVRCLTGKSLLEVLEKSQSYDPGFMQQSGSELRRAIEVLQKRGLRKEFKLEQVEVQ
jgi:hypothetical protein